MSRLNLSLFAALLCLTAAVAAPNLHPDPSFEATGTAGPAHTGDKAAHLQVAKLNHWDAFGSQIAVEPFARYRITEWVKANVGKGTFFAPYVYGWDNFEWAFAGGKVVQTMNDWTQTEYTFVTSEKTIYIAPLAYMECENCEGWADDIVIEKIAEQAQVMSELMAKPGLDDNGKRLLVRWLVLKGDLAGAAKIIDATAGETRADAATVLAQATPDAAPRLPFVIQMVASGGPSYNDGMKRFNEITAGMSASQRLNIAVEAIKQSPNDERVGRSVQMILTAGGPSDSHATIGEALAQLQAQRDSVQAAATAAPAGSKGAQALQAALAKLDESLASVQARKAALGSCTIRIGRKAINPASFAIVTPDQPTPQEAYAAQDLRHHLELITGQVFPIKTEKDNGRGNGFFIGNTRACNAASLLSNSTSKVAAAKQGVRIGDLGLEGLFTKTVGPSVILAGNKRGCLYATSVFLEDYLGCRWFTPDCATWPKSGTINVPAIDRKIVPPLEFRAGDYPIARPGEFAMHCRFNGNNHEISEEQGGRKGVHCLCHTFAGLCPPEKYFATHPEYFSLVGGKRQSGYAQLCLTNPEVLKIVIAGVRQWIKDNPNMKVFSVSQNDTDMHCECPNCQKIADEDGSQMGPVLRFVNAVADDIAKDYPDVAIETLAYQYTRKPPTITKPRPNVIVCLCSIECCFIHPLGEDEFNKTFAADLRGWSKICDRLWIWDYVINYAHSICPFPNLQVLKPNTNFFIKNGVKGIYEESCYYTKGSELQELRNYIMAKTLWDPSYDTRKATSEFCDAFYGAASKPIQQYLDLIEKSVLEAPKLHVQIYTHPRQYVFPDEIVAANKLFDQAEAAVATDPVLLHRVQVARLPIMYAQIVLSTSGTFAEKDGKLVQAEGQDVGSLLDRFATIAHAEGVTSVREGGGDLDAWLSSVPRAPRGLTIETISNPALKAEFLPALGGRLFRLTYLPDNRQLMRVGGEPSALSPTDGGYEEYTEGGYRTPGWSENYAVTQKTPTSLTVAANLRSGLRLTRKYELDPQKPILNITSTLENTSQKPVKASLRAHPEFAVTSTEKAHVVILGADGKQSTINLANPKDPMLERDQWLRDTDMPAGQWTLVDEAAGLAVVNTFNKADVAQALLNRAGQQSRVNLELFGNEATLEPGQSVMLRQSYEVTKP